MKLIVEIIMAMGFIKTIMCCNCQYDYLKWTPLNQARLMYTNLSATVTANCSSGIVRVNTQNTLGQITATQLHIEGDINGLPMVFKDSDSCELGKTNKRGNEDVLSGSFFKEFSRTLCTHAEVKEFQIELPLTDEEKSIFEAFEGEFKFKFCFGNINNIKDENFCADASGKIVCK